MAGGLAQHNWLQNKLYEEPELLGTSRYDIKSKSKEFGLTYNGHLLTVPDLFFGMRQGMPNEVYEVKSAGSRTLFSKGMSQLEKIMMWHQKNGFDAPKARLIMPQGDTYRLWLDMLPELVQYELGDTFKQGNLLVPYFRKNENKTRR